MQRGGPGDYLVATPTFTLLELKALPEFRRLFGQILGLGRYTASPIRKFTLSEAGEVRTFGRACPETPTNVYFGYAEDPESLESATIKAAWLDEAGQKKFKRGSWEAIQRRLAIARGRALITTTPYDLGWLKSELFDRWRAGDPSIDVVQFPSVANPAFSPEEYERARATLPGWKFRMFYMGRYERPAGLIYDCFADSHVIPRFVIPERWPRHLGLDFGGVNTAGIFFAEEPGTGRLFAYREYFAGGRTAREHAEKLLEGEPMLPNCVGGSKSEGQWRAEFRAAGLPVREPAVSDVEVGINRVYGAHKRGEILVFADLARYLDEKRTYSRKLDANGDPTEEIEEKSTFHLLDAERYVVGWLRDDCPALTAW